VGKGLNQAQSALTARINLSRKSSSKLHTPYLYELTNRVMALTFRILREMRARSSGFRAEFSTFKMAALYRTSSD